MGRNVKWTPSENAILSDGWKRGERAADILTRLPGRTLPGMYCQAIKLKLTHKNRFNRGALPPKIDAFMKANPGREFSTSQVAKETGMSASAAYGILTRQAGKNWHWVRKDSLNGKGYKTHIWKAGAGPATERRKNHVGERKKYEHDPITAALFRMVA